MPRCNKARSVAAGGHQQTRRVLVVAEVAIALVLLVSAGLLLRSLQHLFAIDPGFDGSHLLTLQVQTSGDRMNDNSTRLRFLQQSLDAIRNVPGVSAAAFTSQLPLSGAQEDGYGVHFESSPTGKADADNGADGYAVSSEYFETMSIPLHRGRLLDEHDTASAPLVAVISESLARSKFPGHDPLGQRLRIGPASGEPWYTMVGVVGNVKQVSLALTQSDAVYVSSAQSRIFGDRAPWLVVRAHGAAAALTPAIKNAIWSVDKDQPIVRVATMDDLLAASAAERHFALVLFAVSLSCAGCSPRWHLWSAGRQRRRRMREIGVRAALGASRGNIVALVVRQGMALTAARDRHRVRWTFAATQAIATLLFGMSPLDSVTYLSVAALLGAMSIIACSIPAWRAARIDPMVALRYE